MGAPEFAAHFLLHLHQSTHQIVGVVTQPDRPAGRGRVLTAPPVKVEAERLKVTLFATLFCQRSRICHLYFRL